MQEYSYAERHMGTDVALSFVTPTATLAETIAEDVFATINAYEQRFSRFLPDSELSILNETQNMQVSPTFYTVLDKTYELYDRTNGIYNPLVQVARQGYRKDFDEIKAEGGTMTADRTTYDIDLKNIERDPHTRRITLHEGQALDFGGMLKGYLAGQLSHHVRAAYPACTGCIINLGGDLATYGHDPHGNTFTCYVHNPVTDEEVPITLQDSCLVTSGTYKRTWRTNMGTVHHILTTDGVNNPDTPYISASVVHSDGALAEAYAKVLLVDGPAGIDPALQLRFILVTQTGEIINNL